MDGPRYDVFLSHTSSDKPVVEELARILRERGIEPWLDVWHLIPGAPWQEAIEKALQSCATVAVCLGPSGTGPWQNEEMRAAINRRVTDREGTFRVIPVLLPGAERGERSRLPAFLTATTWVEFRDTLDDRRALHRLVCGIRGIGPDPELEGFVAVEGVSPYRGLQFFDVEDARFFFGREALTQWLLDKLRPASAENRFLAIVGPSGSGKSSLARAGLLASLKKGDAIAGSQDWPVAVCKPGAQPLESLAVALTSAARLGDSVSDLRELIRDLREDSRTLHLITRLALHDVPAERRFVVLVDQFEEVFTLCSDEAQRRPFVDNLLDAATAAEGRTVIVLTLRADFYGRCAAYPNLAAAVSDRQILVGAMTRDELRRAIERPALLAGCELEPGLVDLLLEETEGQPGSLPLLQHALLQLWDRRKGRRLTVEAYREIGGVEGALEKYAEGVYGDLPEAEKEVCHQLLLRLVQVGEGTVPTRCRLLLDDLKPVNEAGARAVEHVVQKLAGARLLTTGDEKNPTVELSHEALTTGWKKLTEWIEADREALLVRRQLDDAVEDWIANGREPSYLYRGGRLTQAEEWAASRSGELSRSEREFLDASLALRDAERQRERDRARRFKRLAAGLAAGLALALVAGVVAVLQARQSERRRMTAVARELETRVDPVFQSQPVTGLLLAIQAVRFAREGEDPEIPALEEALRSILASSGGRPLPSGRVTAVTVTPDRRWLATAGEDRKVRAWDLASDDPAASGRVLADLDEGPVLGLALSGDRRWLLTRTVDGAHARIFLRDLASNQGKRELPGEDWLDGSEPFSPGSRWLVTNQAGVPVLRDLRTLKVLDLGDNEIRAWAFTRDERRLAMALQDGPISLWRLTPQGPAGRLVELPESRGRVEGMIFGRDGLSLFAIDADETVRVWRAAPGEPVAFTLALKDPKDFKDPKDPETTRDIREESRPRIELSPDGRLLMSTGDIRGTRLWSIGESFELLTGDSQTSVAGFSAEGRWLLLGIRQKIVLLDLGSKESEEIVRVQSQPLRLATSGPNGRWLVTYGGQEAPRIWDARQGLTIADLEPATRLAGANVLALHENGRHMLVDNNSDDLGLWDLTGRAAPRKLPASQQALDMMMADRLDDPRLWDLTGGADPWKYSAAYRQGLGTPLDFSSTRVAVGTSEGSIVLWDIPAHGEIRPPARLQGPEESVADVALSPDGRWLAGGYFNGDVYLWDLRNRQAAPKRLISHRNPVTALAFGPEESSLATAGSEGTVRLYDLSGEEPRAKLVLDKDTRKVTALTISRDGSWLAIARLGGVELRTREESIRLENIGSHVVELVFSPDRHRLVGYGIEDDVRIWYLDGDRPNPAPVLLAASDLKIRALAFSPDGRRLITASDRGVVRRWALHLDELVKIACEMAGRDLTREEWEEHLPSEPFRRGAPCSAAPGGGGI